MIHESWYKPYRNHSGLIDEKFALIDEIFAGRKDRFDAVVHYEDFVARDPAVPAAVTALGWPVDDGFYDYRRRHDELAGALWRHVPELMERIEFAFGNVQGRAVSERFRDKPCDPALEAPTLEAKLDALCPRLLAHYRERAAAQTAPLAL